MRWSGIIVTDRRGDRRPVRSARWARPTSAASPPPRPRPRRASCSSAGSPRRKACPGDRAQLHARSRAASSSFSRRPRSTAEDDGHEQARRGPDGSCRRGRSPRRIGARTGRRLRLGGAWGPLLALLGVLRAAPPLGDRGRHRAGRRRGRASHGVEPGRVRCDQGGARSRREPHRSVAPRGGASARSSWPRDSRYLACAVVTVTTGTVRDLSNAVSPPGPDQVAMNRRPESIATQIRHSPPASNEEPRQLRGVTTARPRKTLGLRGRSSMNDGTKSLLRRCARPPSDASRLHVWAAIRKAGHPDHGRSGGRRRAALRLAAASSVTCDLGRARALAFAATETPSVTTVIVVRAWRSRPSLLAATRRIDGALGLRGHRERRRRSSKRSATTRWPRSRSRARTRRRRARI